MLGEFITPGAEVWLRMDLRNLRRVSAEVWCLVLGVRH